MNDFVDRLKSWWAQPFNPSGDALGWILFLGLILIAVWAWSNVLGMIKEIPATLEGK